MKVYDPYTSIAGQYDTIIGERDEVSFLKKLVRKSYPQAKNLLELACGTGTLLQHFRRTHRISGLDQSAQMLKIARSRLREASLYHQDMRSFKLHQRFDLILCLFNSLNHVHTFSDWKRVFRQSRMHLNEGGAFIFDINTPLALQNYYDEPCRIQDDSGNVLLTDFSKLKNGCLQMRARVFRKKAKNLYTLSEGRIIERAFPTQMVVNELKKHFRHIRKVDPDRSRAGRFSEVLYFVCYK